MSFKGIKWIRLKIITFNSENLGWHAQAIEVLYQLQSVIWSKGEYEEDFVRKCRGFLWTSGLPAV